MIVDRENFKPFLEVKKSDFMPMYRQVQNKITNFRKKQKKVKKSK